MIPRTRLVLGLTGLALALGLVFGGQARAKSVRVAVTPLSVYAAQELGYLINGIRDMLVSRLASAEIQLIDPSEIEVALSGTKAPLTASTAAEAARKLEADYVIFGSITKLGDRFSLNWQILKADEPTKPTGLARTATEDQLIATVDEMAGLARRVITGQPLPVLVARPAPASTPTPKVEEKKKRSLFFKPGAGPQEAAATSALFRPQAVAHSVFDVMTISPKPVALAVADVDGDRSEDILIIGKKDLAILSLNSGKPVPLARFPSPLPGRLLMVSGGDVDGDGRAEIALTSIYGRLPRCAVFKLEGTKLVKLAELERHHLRIIPSPEGPILIGQQATLSDFFLGAFSRFVLSGGRLVPRGAVPGERYIGFSSLARADLDGDGTVESIGLGYTEKLTVVNVADYPVFVSESVFGGSNNVIMGRDLEEGQAEDRPDIRLNAPVLVSDIDGDGKVEVLVLHNEDLARRITMHISYYRKGSVYAFNWMGSALANTWRTPQIEDYCAGIGLAKVKDKDPILVMAATEPEAFDLPFQSDSGYLLTAAATVGE